MVRRCKDHLCLFFLSREMDNGSGYNPSSRRNRKATVVAEDDKSGYRASGRMHARKRVSASCIVPAHGGEEEDSARDGDDVRGAAPNCPPNSPGTDDETNERVLDNDWVRLGGARRREG